MSSLSDSLSGKLLIAMPSMSDTRFMRSVIYICSHSEDGAMGLIINKLSPQLRFGNLLKQLDLDVGEPERQINIHFGGPVEHGRGFVLHSPDYTGGDGTMTLGDGFAMTATLDVLEDIARGTGPTDVILALGYSGWGPGQLESEIVGNGWLICDASSALVFSADDDAKWAAALDTIGVDAKTLSGSAGHA